MTDIKQKALALVNEVSPYKCEEVNLAPHISLCAALRLSVIEHEKTKQELADFRQDVSDAVMQAFPNTGLMPDCLGKIIIPKPKPDPLVKIIGEINDGPYIETKAEYADRIRAALDALGFEIREKNDDN